jgi:hypothetical protein
MIAANLCASVLTAQAPTSVPTLITQPATLGEIRSVLDKIPGCSEYLHHSPVPGDSAVFDPAMRTEGIASVHFVVGADAVSPRPLGLRILRVAYFSVYDDPSSRIIDSHHLGRIEASGLAAALRAKALGISRNLKGAFDTAGMRFPTAGEPEAKFTADIEIDADAWMPALLGPYNSPLGEFFPRTPGPATAEGAVARQDAEALRTAVRAGELGQATLNRLLLLAAGSARNSSEVIRLLVHRGADPNQLVTRWYAGTQKDLPLTAAVYGSACNVVALLSVGSNPNLRNGEGRSPLDIAVENQRSDVAALLRAAGAVRN